jgi:uncharacterized membrane protein
VLDWFAERTADRESHSGEHMGSIFQSLWRTVAAGTLCVVLLVVLVGTAPIGAAWISFVIRWMHVLCGVMWIGLLWYFNFVQMPSMTKIPDDQKPAVSKVIAPAALFWFRWAALATLLTGATVSTLHGYLVPALTLQSPFIAIGVGMWLGTLMAFNVWFIIWPNQKRALGMIDAEAGVKARSARVAMLTSRVNTMLSVPMLFCMVAQQNGGL